MASWLNFDVRSIKIVSAPLIWKYGARTTLSCSHKSQIHRVNLKALEKRHSYRRSFSGVSLGVTQLWVLLTRLASPPPPRDPVTVTPWPVLTAAPGVPAGVSIKPYQPDETARLLIAYPGELFMRLLKLMIVPLVIASLVTGESRSQVRGRPQVRGQTRDMLQVRGHVLQVRGQSQGQCCK